MRQEVELMKSLKDKSPYMVRYVDDDEDEDGISIFMEYFDNTLLDLIEKKKAEEEKGGEGRFSDLEICDFLIHIASGFVHNTHFYITKIPYTEPLLLTPSPFFFSSLDSISSTISPHPFSIETSKVTIFLSRRRKKRDNI